MYKLAEVRSNLKNKKIATIISISKFHVKVKGEFVGGLFGGRVYQFRTRVMLSENYYRQLKKVIRSKEDVDFYRGCIFNLLIGLDSASSKIESVIIK